MSSHSEQQHTPAIRFTRISYNPTKEVVSLAYEKATAQGWDTHSAKCHRKPAREFHDALQKLAIDCLGIIELTDALLPNEIEVRAVTLTYGKEDAVGCVLTAAREVDASNSPWMIHTPHLPNIESMLFGELYLTTKLETLQQEARRYLGGHGEQLDILASADTDEDDELPADLETDPAGAELVGA
jgi:hypothetical protein